MFNPLDFNPAADSDSSVQSDFHQHEAQALLTGEIREASFDGVNYAFDKNITPRFAY